MQLNPLKLKDKPFFNKYLSLQNHTLSAYAFENIFIWKSMYDVFWTKIDDNLCVFFKDKVGCFLYLPPLGKNLNQRVIKDCFEIMDGINKNRIISRIENVNESQINFYKNLGYKVVLGGGDYICRRRDLVDLKGIKLKKKRSLVNSFKRIYDFEYRQYKSSNEEECMVLYKSWMNERKGKNRDTIYQKLLEDNFLIFKAALKYYQKLNFMGRIIRITDKIRAVTFGYPLGKNSFVILFEVCDLSYKGIAQFIFREFCSELNYPQINIMDDSGLENLKRTKLSYHPYKIEKNFILRYE